MNARTRNEAMEWLRQGPSAAQLRERYPREWAAVQRDLAPIVASGDIDALKEYALSLATAPAPAAGDAALAAMVRRQIAAAAVNQIGLAIAAGTTTGRVRFNLLNGYIAQKLLFARDLERKPVSMFWFGLVWPLLWQRKLLMPLVGPKGIYCFYSRKLISRLADLIGDRPCLEIAAGDGTLSRFLTGAGVDAIATDDHSWTHNISFPAAVLKQDARAALREHQPQVVICSWPPAGNDFEHAVFATDSVELYIVIASRHEFAAGNRHAYEQQTDFSFAEDRALTRLVLPPELDAAVYVFRRTPDRTA